MSNYTKSTNFATKDNLTPGDPLKIVRGTEIDTEFNNIATAIATKTDNASAAVTGGTINDTTIGATTASTGAFTTLAASGNVTLSGGTANGVAYLNGSKVVTSGSALVFDATNTALSVGGAATNTAANRGNISINGTSTAILSLSTGASAKGYVYHSGSDMIINATTGTLALQANGNGALIDSSGNLGLGVTPSAWASYKALQVGSGYSAWSTGVTNSRMFANTYYDGAYKYVGTGRATQYEQDGYHAWYTAPSGTAGNAITFTQAMTLDSSGNLLVGTTSASSTTGLGWKVNNTDTNNVYTAQVFTSTTSAYTTNHLYSTGAGAYRFYVNGAGTVFATSTTISAISDRRFKENVRDLDAGLAEVMALKPRLYDWKEGKGANIKNARGFIAQEFEEVFPDLIDEWKDAAPEGEEPYKSVRQDLIPVLVKAIQELKAEFDAYKASHP
jgi:hypothetical protein